MENQELDDLIKSIDKIEKFCISIAFSESSSNYSWCKEYVLAQKTLPLLVQLKKEMIKNQQYLEDYKKQIDGLTDDEKKEREQKYHQEVKEYLDNSERLYVLKNGQIVKAKKTDIVFDKTGTAIKLKTSDNGID